MPDLADLIVLVFALGLGVPGVVMVVREVLGDRLRRVRVPGLRCPGRWERVLGVVPWRASCWYDMTASPMGADGRRRCPECGRSSPDRRLGGSRRSGVALAGGLALVGLSAIAVKGHSIYLGGVAAAPSWVLALVPFDEQAWFEDRFVNTGDAWRDTVARELSTRNGSALLQGPGAWIMERRVRAALDQAGTWHDPAMLEPTRFRLAQRVEGGRIEPTSLAEAAARLAEASGVEIDVADEAVDPNQTPLNLSPAFSRALLPHSSVALRPLRSSTASLPDWPMSIAQALDILCWRAAGEGAVWRATPEGVVVEALAWNPAFGAYDARALLPGVSQSDSAIERGLRAQGATRRVASPVMVQGVSVMRWDAVLPNEPAARRALAARAWLFRTTSGLATPIREASVYGSAGHASWLLNSNAGAHTGIGQTLLIPALPHEHRALSHTWRALERGAPDPPSADRASLLETLARLDEPGRLDLDGRASVDGVIRAVAEQRGLAIVFDPAVHPPTGAPVLSDPVLAGLATWTPNAELAVVAGPGRVLLTTAATRDMLSEPRMYRLRVSPDRVTADLDSDPLRIHLPTLAQRAKRFAGSIPILWGMHDAAAGELQFVARTTPDEHAMLSWLLEQAGRTLNTGRPSLPSSTVGMPVAIYDLTALYTRRIPQANDDLHQVIPPALLELLSVRPGINTFGSQGLRDVPWFHRAGPIVIVRLSPEDHARLRDALEALTPLRGGPSDDRGP